jgi:hypothetical protein
VDARPVPAPLTLVRRSACALLALFGWRAEIVWPPVANRDFVIGYLAKLASGLPAHGMEHTGLIRQMVEHAGKRGRHPEQAAPIRLHPAPLRPEPGTGT